MQTVHSPHRKGVIATDSSLASPDMIWLKRRWSYRALASTTSRSAKYAPLLLMFVALSSVGQALIADEPAAPQPKMPIPDEAAQKESLALIKDVYRADYEKAKSPAQRLTLTKKMLEEGLQTEGDAAGKFVLLRVARDMATQAGDPTIAIQAIDAIATAYEIDPLEMKVDALTKIAKSVTSAADNKALALSLQPLIATAVASENFLAATQLVGLAITASRNAKDSTLLKEAVARSKEIEQSAAAFADVKKALAKLVDSPTDPDANLLVGKFKCFNTGDWESGLTFLSLSNDTALKPQVEKDISGAKQPVDQVALGDGWWNLAEKSDGSSKLQMRLRAAHWYKQALPGLG